VEISSSVLNAWLPTMLICWIFAETPSWNTSFRSTRLRGSGVTTALTLALYLPTL
jgi:hypothetical protein